MSSDEEIPSTPTSLTNDSGSDKDLVVVPVKDEKYYFEKGDCTFLVEGVLFKVARFHFCRDPDSVFANMFSDAKGDLSEAIPLPNDTAECFRALCWAMYALPAEMRTAYTNPSTVPVEKYLRILDVAHKYLLTDYENWAWNMAQSIPNGVEAHLTACTEDALEHIFDLALRCGGCAPELLALVEKAWLDRVVAGTVTYQRALTVAEDRGRRKLQGDIYWHLHQKLVDGEVVTSPESGFAAFDLTETQLRRLLWGVGLLLQRRSAKADQSTPLKKTSTGSCSNYHCRVYGPQSNSSCSAAWMHEIGTVQYNPNWMAQTKNNYSSHTCLVEHLDRLWQDWQALFGPGGAIADYFLGPLPKSESA
uniref:BTB domain-containing protein n=1 Tax=Mycena chlorophos TaxID=658473 RepID=A0ABQ0MDI9_MYCCL|nr:predicted protein [Mycena chlorophos]